MGSRSDWETMEHAVSIFDSFGIPYEVEVVSAHRTPDKLFHYAESASERGIEVIIAGAGGAAHLPGMIAAKTSLPVLGVPVQSKALSGMDSLLSIVQMPAGIPVGTLAPPMRRCWQHQSWATSIPNIVSHWMLSVPGRQVTYWPTRTPDRIQSPDNDSRHIRWWSAVADVSRGIEAIGH
jgi:phosphoribosylaminoimidazole carboxylase PurE protein